MRRVATARGRGSGRVSGRGGAARAPSDPAELSLSDRFSNITAPNQTASSLTVVVSSARAGGRDRPGSSAIAVRDRGRGARGAAAVGGTRTASGRGVSARGVNKPRAAAARQALPAGRAGAARQAPPGGREPRVRVASVRAPSVRGKPAAGDRVASVRAPSVRGKTAAGGRVAGRGRGNPRAAATAVSKDDLDAEIAAFQSARIVSGPQATTDEQAPAPMEEA